MIYYLLSVYIITEVYEWWENDKSERFLVANSGLSHSRVVANVITYLSSAILGSGILFLVNLFTNNILYFAIATLILFYIKNKIVVFIHYLYLNIMNNKESKQELNNMQKEVLSPDSNKASKILQDHYKNTKK